jgi:resuscitation-promoting factor RpfB
MGTFFLFHPRWLMYSVFTTPASLVHSFLFFGMRKGFWLCIVASISLAWMVGCTPKADYTIHDGGRVIVVSGHYDTVGEVLATVGIDLRPEDGISPDAEAAADPETPILVDRAAEVMVMDLDDVITYYTQAETLGDFLEATGLVPRPGARILADGQPVEEGKFDETPLPEQVIFDSYKTVIITEGENRRSWRTTALTVGEALQEAGVILGPLDTIVPPSETALPPTLDIFVQRAAPYIIRIDGQTLEVPATATVVGDILLANGIELDVLDYTRPSLEATVRPGNIIEIVRVTEHIETEDVPLAFETIYEAAPDLEIDTIVQAGAGSPGVLQRRTRVRLEDGVEVSREPDDEVVTIAPVNAVIRYGTNIVMRTIDTEEGLRDYWRKVNMRVTAYTARSAGKQPGQPGYGITASGVQAGTGVVAVDPRVVPFRSYVYVPGYGVAFAGDTGGGVKGRFIDLGYDEEEYQSWRGTVDVYYLGPPPPADQIRWILP